MEQSSNLGQFPGFEALSQLPPETLATLQALAALQPQEGTSTEQLLAQLGQGGQDGSFNSTLQLLANLGQMGQHANMGGQAAPPAYQPPSGSKSSSKRGSGGGDDGETPRTRYHVYSEDQKQQGLQYLEKYGNCSAAARHLRQDNPDAFPTVTGAHVSFWDKASKRKLGLLPSEPTKRQKAAAGGSIPGSVQQQQAMVPQQQPQAANLDATVHLQLITLIRDIITTQLSAGMTISPEMLRPLVVSCINACGLGYLLEENGGTFQVTDQWLAQVCSIIALTAASQAPPAVEDGGAQHPHQQEGGGHQHQVEGGQLNHESNQAHHHQLAVGGTQLNSDQAQVHHDNGMGGQMRHDPNQYQQLQYDNVAAQLQQLQQQGGGHLQQDDGGAMARMQHAARMGGMVKDEEVSNHQ
mmetsp:Transcript_17402/g.29860  ORF Transcript_17402/g.29860 Transcript_17402/m.29860 type:complete len:410 (+) Transcript_17402:56-1285(+)